MNRESFEKFKNQRLASILLSAGINPKYKAFGYLLYLLREFESDEIISMSNKEMISHITKKFNVTREHAVANFKCMMSGSAFSFGKRSALFSLIPRLAYDELPTISEFIVAVECYIWLVELLIKDDIDKGKLLSGINNSPVNNGTHNS